ncbi:hypothetical protein HAX54_053391 [Datura stramonium]|uniref:Uncharacterized protein n=1 Tax=Datura stramonium TaxID=4076 RepID=A0ABS8T2I8_DATST|nr:hypothetical protein [Datura stramonium]
MILSSTLETVRDNRWQVVATDAFIVSGPQTKTPILDPLDSLANWEKISVQFSTCRRPMVWKLNGNGGISSLSLFHLHMVATKVLDISANANELMRRMSTTEVAVFCSDDFLSGLIKTLLEMIRNARKTTDATKRRTDIHWIYRVDVHVSQTLSVVDNLVLHRKHARQFLAECSKNSVTPIPPATRSGLSLWRDLSSMALEGRLAENMSCVLDIQGVLWAKQTQEGRESGESRKWKPVDQHMLVMCDREGLISVL